MRILLGFLFAAVVVCNSIDSQLTQEIREKTHLWQTHEYYTNPLRHKTEQQLKQLLGAPVEEKAVQTVFTQSDNIPLAFDSREQWPNCNYQIQDQQQCGSCVYFSSAVFLGQRFCIASNGTINTLLSPQYIMNCDTNPRNQKCRGAYLDSVNQFLVKSGTVEKQCVNYISGNGLTYEACQSKCRDGSNLKIYKCQNLKKLTNPTQIQTEILKNGPVQTQYNVYSDFYNYKSGIYHYVSGSLQGGHAVTLLGWGQQDGVNFWIAQNQWNEKWGEQGFFKIAFGQVGIDSNAYACQPVLGVQPQPTPPEPTPPVPPTPTPPNPQIDCQKQVMECLSKKLSVTFCNQQFFNCLYNKKSEKLDL